VAFAFHNVVEVLLLSKRPSWYLPLVVLAVLLASANAPAQTVGGLKAGAKAPSFALKDAQGTEQTLSTLTGPKGLLLLFFRSADWCPFCKGQLVDLEGAQKAFEAKGINVAAVSYDSPAILADFARRRSITYPLLSDTHSKLIDAFGIRNPEGAGIEAGIPYPGYYLIKPDGAIERRFFETTYVNRLTASNLYSNLFGNFPLPTPVKELDATPHVSISTLQSDSAVTPGSVLRLAVVITPGPDTHIYAPGAEKLQYHVASLTINPSELYEATGTSYPKSELLNFADLNESVPVYTGPTAFSTDVAAVVSRTTIPLFAKNQALPIKGVVSYQACTSKVCFPPVSIPVEWTVSLKQLDLERAPEDIRHK
jgi:peroxiredoxin